MSIAILKIGENGTLRQLEKKWFSVSLSNYVDPDEERNQGLGLSNYTYMFVISSFLAFLTVLHRYFDAIYHMYSKEKTPGDPPVQDALNVAPVQEMPLNVEVQVIWQPPIGPQNIDLRQGMGRLSQRTRRTASFSIISTVNRVLLSFLSDRPQRAKPIEEQSLRDRAEHEVEDQPNLGFLCNDPRQGSSDLGSRFQRAASSTNISGITRVPQSFYSLQPRRAQEIEDNSVAS